MQVDFIISLLLSKDNVTLYVYQLFVIHFRVLAKNTVLYCAFHLRKGGVLWPRFLIAVVGTIRK